ncbi:glycosyltransferase [Paenibacillus woosongensis]|uniref:Glycosyltransferase n=1 Tax=Paenibacillus woosongensis TaxID=307580 RepID=A0AA95KTC5_9BACL|nr:TPR domain-containing glycosyltransferase [Paenibacillus woosongensis]WHX48713.1 glycosyltransferase [Paenibacillus woosongensis]
MKKSTISLCMIVKNEERCIERCLNSVASVVDEIIIVDTGSTDQTLELVSKFDAKVFHYQWDNHFANARNYAIQQANCDYILHLDADEWIEDPFNQLNQYLNDDIYYIPIRNDLGGGLAEVHKFPRLFRRIPELMYQGAIHEQIDIQLNWHRSNGVLDQMIIHHDGYLEKVVDQKGKIERNLKILLKEVDENPSSFNYYNLGQQYFTSGEYMKAVEAYKKSYSYGGNYTFTKRLLLGLIQSLMMLKQYKDALSIAKDSFKLYPDYVEFKYYEGMIYQELGYLPDANKCFEKCIQIGDSDSSVHFNTYEGTGSYLAYARAAEIAYSNFDFEQANELLKKAIRIAPNVMGLVKSFLDFNNHIDTNILYKDMLSLWPHTGEVIQHVIAALYTLRHPLLLSFINRYEINCDEEVQSFVNLLNGNYKDSGYFWFNKDEITVDNFRDVLALSILLKDRQLMERYLNLISLRSDEKKSLLSIVEMKPIKQEKYTKEFCDILSILLTDLLKLQQYDYFDYFTKEFTTPQLRYVIAKTLYEFGFYENVLEVLIQSEVQEEDFSINELAAMSLRHLSNMEDSLYYYWEAYKIKQEPELAFHICELALQLNDIDSLKAILGDMMNWKIESAWVKRKLSGSVY